MNYVEAGAELASKNSEKPEAASLGNSSEVEAAALGNGSEVEAASLGNSSEVEAASLGNSSEVEAASLGNSSEAEAGSLGNSSEVGFASLGNSSEAEAGSLGNSSEAEAVSLGNSLEAEAAQEADALTHVGPDGRANMVDVGGKADTEREAVAVGSIFLGMAQQCFFRYARCGLTDIADRSVKKIRLRYRNSKCVPQSEKFVIETLFTQAANTIQFTENCRIKNRSGARCLLSLGKNSSK